MQWRIFAVVLLCVFLTISILYTHRLLVRNDTQKQRQHIERLENSSRQSHNHTLMNELETEDSELYSSAKELEQTKGGIRTKKVTTTIKRNGITPPPASKPTDTQTYNHRISSPVNNTPLTTTNSNYPNQVLSAQEKVAKAVDKLKRKQKSKQLTNQTVASSANTQKQPSKSEREKTKQALLAVPLRSLALNKTMEPVQGVCEGHETTQNFCANVYKTPGKSQTNYKLHFVSGIPGSGNDWILWLGSVIGYERNLEYLLSQCEVYHYLRRSSYTKLRNGTLVSNCIYMKSHEPYFFKPGTTNYTCAEKAAVILRHPFDAAFSEYKRLLVEAYARAHKKSANVWKSGIEGFSLKDFFSDVKNRTIAPNSPWTNRGLVVAKHFMNHAEYWLTEFKKPLLPIIYADFKASTSTQLPKLLEFFDYKPDATTIDKYCCVLARPFNPALKRQTSVIDQYREELLEKTPGLKAAINESVTKVQKMLDDRWPGKYTIRRG